MYHDGNRFYYRNEEFILNPWCQGEACVRNFA